MKIYSLWNGDTCECEYFKTKEFAQKKGRELITDLLVKFSIPEEEYEEIYNRFCKIDSAYYYRDVFGREVKVELAAIDEIIVQD